MKYEIRYFALIKCFILTFLLINHNSTCQNVYSYCDTVNDNCGTLSFFVYDSKNGYGVPSVIILTNDKDTFNLKTDNGGHLMFNGREGRYDITIYAADYNPLQTYFYIEKGKCLDVKIILEKQNKTFVEYQKYEYPIIEGYVVDNETGKPLSDVKVTIEDENNVVYTDEKGFFTIMPKKFSIISDPDDEVVRNNITFSKNDYKTEKIIDLLIVPDKIKLIIHLHRGEGIIENKKIQHVLDGDMDESENIDSIKYNQEINQNIDFYDVLKDCRATCNIPSTIRVGTNCSGINCTGVTTMSLQYYTESGLDDEWIASWHTESLKAGSIPYRTYGGYYVQHPVSSNYDIASSTSNQVWGSAIYTATKSAAQATTGKILTTSTGTNPVRSEYSAENNYGGSSYNCSNGYAGGSGSYPCYSDNICSGKSPSGHGRGMCQWGSQRWANNGKDYNWIVNHYYIATVNYRVCSNAAPTNLTTTLLGCPDNKVKFSWQNSGTGWYIQVSTNSSFPQTNSYIKWVSGLTTYTGPDGFVLQSNGTTPLGSFASSTTYYWRIYYGNNNYTATKNFTTLNCNPPNVTVTANPSSICKGKSSTLTASGASTYSWSHSLGSGASKTVTPTTTTTYTVTGTGSNGVTKSVTVKVTVNPTPTVTASASPSTICSGASSVLTAGGASTYSWSGGLGTGSSKTVSPTSTTTYAVTGTSTAGCTGTKSVTVTVNPTPTVTASASSSTICSGSSSTLTAGGASTYSWSHSLGSGASKTVTPTTTTTYTVTGTSAEGCTGTKSVTVTVNPIPTVTASASPSTICSGSSSTLTAGGASTYSWSNSLGTGSSKTVSPTSTTTYTVTGTSAEECTGTKTVTVTVNPTPTVTASASPSTICSGASSDLTASGANTYNWSTGENTDSITVTPTSTTTYTVTGTSAEECTGTKTVTVTVNPTPTVTASASPSTICSGASSDLTASGANTYNWSTGENTDSITVTPTSTTTYTVTGTSAEECYNTATVTITVNPSPSTPIISQIYENPIILVSSSISGNQWYLNDNPISGATDQTYIVNENGNYFTIVTIDGCSSLPSNQITINNVGINDYANDEILVYPNPAQNIIYIQSSKPINEVMIINNLGQIVAHYSETGIIDINQLADGVYQIMIKTEDNIKVLPLIKIK